MARERRIIEMEHEQLAARLFVPSDYNGAGALFIHGFGSRGQANEQYAKQAVQHSVTCLTFDLTGHGDSETPVEDISVEQHLKDVVAAYDLLADIRSVEPGRIGVAGMSFGGYLATLLTLERPVEQLLLRSPALYPDHLRDKPRAQYTDAEALQAPPDPENPALTAIRQFMGRVTLVSSEHDTVIPSATIDAYAEAASDLQTHVLPNAQHYLDADSQRSFKPIVLNWAKSL